MSRRFFNIYLILLYIFVVIVGVLFCVYFFKVLPDRKIKTDNDTIYLKLNETVAPRIWSSLLNDKDAMINWKSEKPKIISVDNGGKITALSEGSSIVTVTIKSGRKVENKSILVVTTDKNISLTKFYINSEVVSLIVNDNYKILYTLIPSNASNKRIVWSSTDSSIASVSSDGNVKALKSGEVIINGVTVDGHLEGNMKVIVK